MDLPWTPGHGQAVRSWPLHAPGRALGVCRELHLLGPSASRRRAYRARRMSATGPRQKSGRRGRKRKGNVKGNGRICAPLSTTAPTLLHRVREKVSRPPDRCTGGETGSRKRFSLLPRPGGTKKGHYGQNSKFNLRSTFRGDLLLRRSGLVADGLLLDFM